MSNQQIRRILFTIFVVADDSCVIFAVRLVRNAFGMSSKHENGFFFLLLKHDNKEITNITIKAREQAFIYPKTKTIVCCRQRVECLGSK